MTAPAPHNTARKSNLRLRARQVLISFLLTFIAARVLVFLIMQRKIPDLFLHLSGTHVHHLNYGIFLLSAVGAWLIFAQPHGRKLSWAATLYGFGLALTFDEFGMWLHLGGGYWQRASFDAVTVVAGILGLFAYAPSLAQMRATHWSLAALVWIGAIAFFVLLTKTLRHAEDRLEPHWQQLEQSGPQ